ncbi:DoxX family protein [Salinibacter ruber]|uniref:DoxX family protein n=1 Tax=Salinibacter ruber TaxID=146919 RepID=UPI0021687ABC|nr:DoxX family protein [Salinibacter ruber]MCS3639418.1 putative membrane protein YphA (DoxX/SURF4 family) [Salinibacter ruber]
MASPQSRSPSRAAWWTLPLVRLMVGAVFLSEGLQKFLYPVLRGPGRFADMGWPVPEGVASLVGGVEVVCGLLILIGFYTRLAAAGTATIMTTAIITTKIPIWLGEGFGPFEVRTLGEYGFWSMAHAMRTDWAMLLGSLVLVIAGAGPWAADST